MVCLRGVDLLLEDVGLLLPDLGDRLLLVSSRAREIDLEREPYDE